MATPLRVLLIEDSEDDAELITRELGAGGYAPSWERVETAEALRAALGHGAWDVILCDFVMPKLSALAALPIVRELAPDTPVLVVSGETGDEVALTATRAGAHDFVSKRFLSRLVPAVRRDLHEADVRRAHRRAEVALRASERQFRLLFERSLDAILIADDDGHIRNVNRAACELFGLGREMFLRMHIGDLQMLDADDTRARFAAYRQRGRCTGQGVILRSDGERRTIEYRGGTFSHGLHLFMVRDQTDRELAAEALRVSEAQWRTLLAEATDLIFTLDPNGRVTWLNGKVCAVTGYSAVELIGRSPLELVRTEHMAEAARALATVLAGGAIESAEVEICARNGTRVVLEVRGRTLWDGERLVETFHIARDITQRKRAEERMGAMMALNRTLTAGLPAAACQQQLLQVIGQGIGWPIGELWLRAEGSGVLVRVAAWHDPHLDGDALASAADTAAAETPPSRACASGEAVLCDEPFAGDSASRQVAGRALGLCAGFAFPLSDGVDVVGAMVFFGRAEIADPIALREFGSIAGAIIGQCAARRWPAPRHELVSVR